MASVPYRQEVFADRKNKPHIRRADRVDFAPQRAALLNANTYNTPQCGTLTGLAIFEFNNTC